MKISEQTWYTQDYHIEDRFFHLCNESDQSSVIDGHENQYGVLRKIAKLPDCVRMLKTLRQLIDNLPRDAFGIGHDNEGNVWPITEEVIHDITALLRKIGEE